MKRQGFIRRVVYCSSFFAALICGGPVAVRVCAEPSQRRIVSTKNAHVSAAGSPSRLTSHLPGIVEPGQQAQLAAPLDGVLMSVLVREGQEVKAGQILAVIDNQVSRVQLELAAAAARRTAGSARARQELKTAQNLLDRLLSVTHRGAVSALEIQQATHGRDQALVDVSEAKERMAEARLQAKLARVRLEAHNLRAPFAGRILRVDAKPGESATTTSRLVHLVDLSRLRVNLHVKIEYYDRLVVGNSYKLNAAQPVSSVISANLTSKEPIVNAATQTFRCVFDIDNRGHRFPAGFTVKLLRPKIAGENSRLEQLRGAD